MATQLNARGERGHIMLVAALVIILVAVFGFSMVESVTSAKDEGAAAAAGQHRMFLAESALDAAYQDLQAGGTGTVGTEDDPVRLGGGAFFTVATDRGDGTTTVFAVGLFERGARTIRARIRMSKPVFHHAIFAGNSSGDPDYEMTFGGTGADADDINGDVYSGGSILVEGDADVSGTTRAKDTITGATGDTGVSQSGFDFSGVDWSAGDIVDVTAEFAANATPGAADSGGTADQVPATNAAHIFRRNPDDRGAETASTTKDDYFLEDPYEVWRTDPDDDGSDPSIISIDDGSGVTERAYYIDGNLWVHSKSTMSFMINSVGSGTKVSFIVRGNITFSDNFRLDDTTADAVGFIALKDPDVPDSGNIYLGDPAFGTLKEMHGFLYAENDFVDVNLDADGSKAVRVLGSMSAGNHVAIDRTFEGGQSKLTLDWDQRLLTGTTSLPFISTELPSSSGSAVVEAWVESPLVSVGTPSPVSTLLTPTPPVEEE